MRVKDGEPVVFFNVGFFAVLLGHEDKKCIFANHCEEQMRHLMKKDEEDRFL